MLLHEDTLILSPETGYVTQSSLRQMERIANDFFYKLGMFAASGYGKKDFELARQIFLEACQLNHIRYSSTKADTYLSKYKRVVNE